ncbi:hypothetical protein [Ammoniphilus sp. YIM 78166]|uniref:hypothetical protein n=1 Tax=Ammoniphilus sp. YIM 78166 TaxID=1644106 RepID=UPI0010702C33|nr:hypothetical protein [Ammoniphilus sp. YIM 78166]
MSFREILLQEANELIERIKAEEEPAKKHSFCSQLLEILEELDIDYVRDSVFWDELQLDYRDFLVS